jgi:hypothetical protein
MSADSYHSSIYQFPAAIKRLESIDCERGQRLRVFVPNGEFDALSWMPAQTLDGPRWRVPTGWLTLGELEKQEAGRTFALLGFEYDGCISLEAIVSPETCPIAGVVEQALGLVAQIGCPAIRRFVEQALMLEGAFPHFWTCPASLHDHHATVGGLAHHSLEVATMVASAANLTAEARDFGVAMALLHDLGKVWAYKDGTETREAQALGHERIAYARLAPVFAQLQAEDESLGLTMQALLGGEWRAGARKRRFAIGSVVNAFDQMSCENWRQKERRFAGR